MARKTTKPPPAQIEMMETAELLYETLVRAADGMQDEILKELSRELARRVDRSGTEAPEGWTRQGWRVRECVRCVECPECLFAFDAIHEDSHRHEYSCPNCGHNSPEETDGG